MINKIINNTESSFLIPCFLLATLLFLTGCEKLVKHGPVAPEVDKLIKSTDQPVKKETYKKSPPESVRPAAETVEKQPEFYPGNGVFIGHSHHTGESGSHTRTSKGDITLNFQDTDIHEVTKVILGDLLKKNYAIDPAVVGTVNIQTSNPLTREDLMPVLQKLLQMVGATMLDDGNLIKVVPASSAALSSLPPGIGRHIASGKDGFHTQIMPLRYVGAEEISKILKPFSKDTVIQTDPQRNLIILSGSQSDLRRLVETVQLFDVDWLRGMSLAIVPVNHAEATDILHELDELFGKSSGSPMAETVRFVALERLNSIIVVSRQPRYLREMSEWIRRLDRSGDVAGQKLYVYQVQNTRAEDLAKILNNIFSNQGGSTHQIPDAQVAPGLEPVVMGDNENDNQKTEKSKQHKNTETSSKSSVVVGGSGVSLPASNAIKIIADDTNNALLILATSTDYDMVESALKKLDITPLQVLIEASIIEVSLTDDLSYGLEWFFKTESGIGNKNGKATLDLGEAGLKALAPGFSYAIVDAADTVRAVLNTLASESKVKVLSSPSLMVLDNHTASINVGDQVPIPTRRSVSNLDPQAPTVNEIEYRDTGVLLTITPRVNENGLIIMEVKQEVSDVSKSKSIGVDAPIINQRSIESTIAVNSGNTIVLGGLIRDNRTDTESGIPGLKDVPLAGALFRQKSNELRRTELVVLLTPRAIHNENDAWEVTNEFKHKLQDLHRQIKEEEPFLQKTGQIEQNP